MPTRLVVACGLGLAGLLLVGPLPPEVFDVGLVAAAVLAIVSALMVGRGALLAGVAGLSFLTALAIGAVRMILLHGNEIAEVNGNLHPVGAGMVIGTLGSLTGSFLPNLALLLGLSGVLGWLALRLRGAGEARLVLRALACLLLVQPLVALGGGTLIGILFDHMTTPEALLNWARLACGLALVTVLPACAIMGAAGRRAE